MLRRFEQRMLAMEEQLRGISPILQNPRDQDPPRTNPGQAPRTSSRISNTRRRQINPPDVSGAQTADNNSFPSGRASAIPNPPELPPQPVLQQAELRREASRADQLRARDLEQNMHMALNEITAACIPIDSGLDKSTLRHLHKEVIPVSYTHLTLPTICSV